MNFCFFLTGALVLLQVNGIFGTQTAQMFEQIAIEVDIDDDGDEETFKTVHEMLDICDETNLDFEMDKSSYKIFDGTNGIYDCSCRPPKKQECGIANEIPNNLKSGIVGGHVVEPWNKYPWQVELRGTFNVEQHFCGASIISDTVLLTAGHCIGEAFEKGTLTVWGSVFDSENRTYAKKLEVQEYLRHEKYEAAAEINAPVKYDFALLRLNESIQFNETIRPVCLPKSSRTVEYTGNGIATGWGDQKSNDTRITLLMEVSIPFTSNEKCDDILANSNRKEYLILTAIDQNDIRTIAHGDSGGPLVIKENGTYTQVGIASGGAVSDGVDHCGVFARLTGVLDWINDFVHCKIHGNKFISSV